MALLGPTSLYFSPSSSRAFLPPLSEVVKYGLLTCLGRKPTVRPFFSVASGFALPALAAGPELSLTSFFVVPPHAVAARAREVATASAAPVRRRVDLRMAGFL